MRIEISKRGAATPISEQNCATRHALRELLRRDKCATTPKAAVRSLRAALPASICDAALQALQHWFGIHVELARITAEGWLVGHLS